MKKFIYIIFIKISLICAVNAQVPMEGKYAQLDFEQDCVDQIGHLTSDSISSSFLPSRRGKDHYSLQSTPSKALRSFYLGGLFSGKKIPETTFSFWFKSSTNSVITLMSTNRFNIKADKGLEVKLDDSSHISIRVFPEGSGKQFTQLVGKRIVKKGRWNHVAVEFISGNKVALFLNGKPDTLTTFKNPLKLLGVDSLCIGEANRNDTLAFDDLRIYSVALTPPLIFQLYEEYKIPNVVMVDLNTPDSANSLCTVYANITPDGEEVHFSNPKYHKMQGYTIKVINRRMEELANFSFNGTDHYLPRKKMLDDPFVFIEIFDREGLLVQVYPMQFLF